MADKMYSRHSLQNAPKPSCFTKIETETYENLWTIENYTHCQDEYLISADFATADGKQITWYHRLWPSLFNSASRQMGTVMETAIKSCNSPASLNASIKVEILQKERNHIRYKTSGVLKAGETIGTFSLAINRATLLDEKNNFLPNNVLQLRILVTISKAPPCQGGNANIAVPESQFLPGIASLFCDTKYSDVTIIVGNREFFCHKAILAVRSPAFAAIFDHRLVPSTGRPLIITDIEPEVFQELLRFIYTDQVENIAEMAIHLLPLSNKYAVDRLKALCEQTLYASISVESACSMLILADLHRAEQLKRQIVGFIRNNRTVLATEHWKKLYRERIDLINYILVEVCESHKL